STITSNTSTTITIDNNCVGYGQVQNRPFDPGDSYEIRRVVAALDQTGRGQGDKVDSMADGFTPVNTVTGTQSWPNQASEPSYFWNNTYNGSPATAATVHGAVTEGIDYFNTAMPGYTPYAYPHPLIAASCGGG